MEKRYIPHILFPKYYQEKLSLGIKDNLNFNFDKHTGFNQPTELENLSNRLKHNTNKKIERLKKLEEYLNEKQIEIIDNIKIFDFTKNRFIGKWIVEEHNIGKGWTNGWRKIYEILFRFKFLKNMDNLKHFDICGYPGAFILGTNHYIKTHTKIKNYDWFIQSYNQTQEDTTSNYLNDSYGLHQKYPDRFLFGSKKSNYSGDITDRNNILEYYNKFKDDKMDLVTSDCGLRLDFDIAYMREQQMSKIFFGQLICGLMVLKKGGNLVMKTYSQFEPWSISLLYLITQLFENVYLCKPESSRFSSGKEIYIIGENNLDVLDTKDFDKLLDILESFENDKDLNKTILSIDKMNKEIINNIVAIVNDYYTKNFKRVKVSRKIIYSYNYLTKNPEEYIKNLKDYEYFTTKIKRRFYHNYFIRMEYKKINAEDKLL